MASNQSQYTLKPLRKRALNYRLDEVKEGDRFPSIPSIEGSYSCLETMY